MERDFGTGALKITPGHDPVDFEVRPAAPHLLGLHSPTADSFVCTEHRGAAGGAELRKASVCGRPGASAARCILCRGRCCACACGACCQPCACARCEPGWSNPDRYLWHGGSCGGDACSLPQAAARPLRQQVVVGSLCRSCLACETLAKRTRSRLRRPARLLVAGSAAAVFVIRPATMLHGERCGGLSALTTQKR